jgi:excisionase family DNA binding protein
MKSYLITISDTELSTLVFDAVSRAMHLNDASNVSHPPSDTTLLIRKQTAALLGISLPTLNEWNKSGEVTGYRIRASIRYKKAEVEQSLNKIKYSRDRK